jgi:hypothetical protein
MTGSKVMVREETERGYRDVRVPRAARAALSFLALTAAVFILLLILADGTAAATGTISPDGSRLSTDPEPISMAVVAAGLAGMAGMGFFRRHKVNNDLG